MDFQFFQIQKAQSEFYPWQLVLKAEVFSLPLLIGIKLIDIIIRFINNPLTCKIINCFEYDLNITIAGTYFKDLDPENQNKITQMKQSYLSLKSQTQENRLEQFYKIHLNSNDFLLGLGQVIKLILISNKLIENKNLELTEDLIPNLSKFFTGRYKINFIIHKNLKFTYEQETNEQLFVCVFNFSQKVSLLMTQFEFDNLLNFDTKLNFPYLYNKDWKNLLKNSGLSNGLEDKLKNNLELIQLLGEILLECDYDQDEVDLVLKEYTGSGVKCESLDLLQINRLASAQGMDLTKTLWDSDGIACEKCENIEKDVMIKCESHVLCNECRAKLFFDNYSSACPSCLRSYSLTELSILNSYEGFSIL